MKLQTSGVLGTSYAIAKLAPKRDIFPGNVIEIKIQEKIMIYGYAVSNGHLPPGNRIFR